MSDQLREALEWVDSLHPNNVFAKSNVLPPLVEAARLVVDAPLMWICLVDAEFSCNGYLSGAIADPSEHEKCGRFALVKIEDSPVLAHQTGDTE